MKIWLIFRSFPTFSVPRAMPRAIHHHEHDDQQFPPKSIQISIFCINYISYAVFCFKKKRKNDGFVGVFPLFPYQGQCQGLSITMNMTINNFLPNPFKYQFFASIISSLSANMIEKTERMMDL